MTRAGKIIFIILILSLTIVPAALAQDDVPAVNPGSVSGIIAGDGQFTTMAAALQHSGLMSQLGGGSWTLFAPTDQAFANIGVTAENFTEKYDEAQARHMVLYHALPTQLSTGELKAMLGDVTMANGSLAGLKFFEDHIYVNDNAKAFNPNILATNGYIHAVDRVVRQPWPRDTSGWEATLAEEAEEQDEAVAMVDAEIAAMGVPANSLAAVAFRDGRFDAFGNAMVAAGLADDFSGGSWTAFIPTDAAFRRIGLPAGSIADLLTQEELASLVLYHVLPGHYSTSTLRTILGDNTMANGKLAGLKLFRSSIWVNDTARVMRSRSNIAVNNGMIHGVNNVILPPWPRVDTPPDVEPESLANKFNKDLP